MPEKHTAFKSMDVADLFDDTRIATFERPHERSETIIITTPPGGDFHLGASTLRVIAEVLTVSPSRKEIK